jgi:hypothetical protein
MIGNLLTLITVAASFWLSAVTLQTLLASRVRVTARSSRVIAPGAIDSDES